MSYATYFNRPKAVENDGLSLWLDEHAEGLDTGSSSGAELLAQLAKADVFRIGVPEASGGLGGSVSDAVDAIGVVAEHSLTAAFVFWGHRTFIEYLVQSPNESLRERLLPALFKGEIAGATGLSNAMKYLCGIEPLQLSATPNTNGWQLDGKLPWVTNLRRPEFVLAAAVEQASGGSPSIVAIFSGRPGVERTPDLELISLRASNTAAVNLVATQVTHEDIIHLDARRFLPQVRPAFLSMQCGMSIGLARASLLAAEKHGSRERPVLKPRIEKQQAELVAAVTALHAGLEDGRFSHGNEGAAILFKLRIRLAASVRDALELELEASGGRAYLLDCNREFVRRWREAAFVPVVTPSLTQLQSELNRFEAAALA
jgi:alkylation response protein AidB-like acyl-CoA dehydrogenase